MHTPESLVLLGLSKKESQVLFALQDGYNTPVKISARTGVSRTAIYPILERLRERGLVGSSFERKRKRFFVLDARRIEKEFSTTEQALLRTAERKEEERGRVDSSVMVHRGREAVRKVLNSMLEGHKHERFYAIIGTMAAPGWDRVLTPEEINQWNKTLKKNRIIAEGVYEEGLLERETRRMGISWAKEFEGRTTRVNEVSSEYFRHGAQVFVFKHSVYLFALQEEVIVEIRSSEIQKMILAFFRFMQDHTRTVDANAILRELVQTMSKT